MVRPPVGTVQVRGITPQSNVIVHIPAVGPLTVTNCVLLNFWAQTPDPAMPTPNVDDVTEVRPPAEKVRVKFPSAPFTVRPLKVATPDAAVRVLPVRLADPEPDAIDAVIRVEESDVLTFPAASTTRTTGCVERATPIAVALPGCVWIDSAAAAPTVRLKFDDVTDPRPAAVKVRLWVVGDTKPTSVVAVNVATPDDEFAVVVPPIVPVDDVTVTAVAGCDVTAFPPTSTTVTAGEPAITPPDTLVVGCVDTFNAEAAPTVNVKLELLAVG